MALDYTGLFGDLGALISRINSYQTLGGTTLPADITTLVSQFSTRWLPEEGIAAFYESLRSSIGGWREALTGWCDRRLLDRDTVLVPLGLTRGSVRDVVQAVYKRMLADGKTLKACTAGVGTPTPKSLPANYGNGTVYTTLQLDGFSQPGRGMPSNLYYDGLLSQLTTNETMVLECVGDSALAGLAEGSEIFSWLGATQFPEYDTATEGSGPGPTVPVANGYGILQGVDFETFSLGVPSGWAATGGTAQDTAIYYRGASSCKLVGNGTLSQTVSPSAVSARRRYLLAVAVYTAAPIVGALLRLQFTGTGYNPGPNLLEVAGVDFPTGGWKVFQTWLTMPAFIPSDLGFSISLTGSGGATVRIDSLALAPAVWHSGVGVGITAGSTRWQRNDRVTFTTTNDQAGKFQTFFRRHYGVQLPSIASGPGGLTGTFLTLPMLDLFSSTASTINDSWAG